MWSFSTSEGPSLQRANQANQLWVSVASPPFLFSLIRTPVIGFRAHPTSGRIPSHDPSANHICKDPISMQGPIHRKQGLRLGHPFLGGGEPPPPSLTSSSPSFSSLTPLSLSPSSFFSPPPPSFPPSPPPPPPHCLKPKAVALLCSEPWERDPAQRCDQSHESLWLSDR